MEQIVVPWMRVLPLPLSSPPPAIATAIINTVGTINENRDDTDSNDSDTVEVVGEEMKDDDDSDDDCDDCIFVERGSDNGC